MKKWIEKKSKKKRKKEKKRMHFSLISLKSFNRGPVGAAAGDAASAAIALRREFLETQNKIDNKLLVFEATAGEPLPPPPSMHKKRKIRKKERKKEKKEREKGEKILK